MPTCAGVCGIVESGGVELWHVGALVSVKQGARVGECKGVERWLEWRQNGQYEGVAAR